jgi:hypothetical protein
MTKVTNITNWPVMPSNCPTCPFRLGENGREQSPDIAGRVRSRCLTTALQICHHPRLIFKKETHLCRGARDFQLQIFYRLGMLDDPTDEDWAKKAKESLDN